jgi:hypothetical protein
MGGDHNGGDNRVNAGGWPTTYHDADSPLLGLMSGHVNPKKISKIKLLSFAFELVIFYSYERATMVLNASKIPYDHPQA